MEFLGNIDISGGTVILDKATPTEDKEAIPFKFFKEELEKVAGGFDGLSIQGDYNANTGLPAIPAPDSTNKGWFWRVSVAGQQTINGNPYDLKIGDWVVLTEKTTLHWVFTRDIATKADAEAGTDNSKQMTPLRVKEAITHLGGISFSKDFIASDWKEDVGKTKRSITITKTDHGLEDIGSYNIYEKSTGTTVFEPVFVNEVIIEDNPDKNKRDFIMSIPTSDSFAGRVILRSL